MAGKTQVRRVDKTVGAETLSTDLEYLSNLVRPHWEKNFIFKKLQGGMVNNIYRCSNGDDLEDALIVRVNSLQSVCNLVDRERELFGLQIGHAAGITEPLHIIINNGMVYGYATGKPMNWGYLWDDNVSRNFMRCLAKLHLVDVEKLSLVNLEGKSVHIKKEYLLMKRLKEAVQAIPEKYTNFPERKERAERLFWPKDRLMKEVLDLEKHFDSFSFNVTFSHNDGWVNNVLYDKEKDKLSFLDYECCDFNYEAYDLALLFNCFQLFEHYHELPDGMVKVSDEEMKLPRDDAFKRKLTKFYLEEKCRIEKNDPTDFTEEELEKFYTQALMLEIFVFFYWTLFQMPQFDDPVVDWDIIKNTQNSFEAYVQHREKLFSFKP